MAKKKQVGPKLKRKPGIKAQNSKSRTVATPKHRSFRLSKREKRIIKPIIPGRRIARQSWQHLTNHWKVFAGITAVYLILTLIFVRGFGAGTDIIEVKDIVTDLFADSFGSLITNVGLVAVIVASSNEPVSEAASVYQTSVVLVTVLAVVWALRQTHAGNDVNAKNAFYKGMYPLIPFIIIIAVMGLQLLPAVGGLTAVNVVFSNGLAVTTLERTLWYIFLSLTCLLSIYMLASSFFALFIVTLADMTPLGALRSARQLVVDRRWAVVRRLLVLPLILLIVTVAVMLPIIYVVPAIAEWVFFVLSGIIIVFIFSYLYNLYRALL